MKGGLPGRGRVDLDPDGNGVDLYRDRPPEEWPSTPTGMLAMGTARFDLDDLLLSAEEG